MLTDNATIRAMSIHYNCPPQCLVLSRALNTLSTEYTPIAPEGQCNAADPARRSVTGSMRSEEFSELDHQLADKLRELQNLYAHIKESK